MRQCRESFELKGTDLQCKGWVQEAALRMLMNNLDPDVAERPEDLVVYGGSGKAARSWEAYEGIIRSLQDLESDETLLVQSGKPVGILRTHVDAPAGSDSWSTWWENGPPGITLESWRPRA